MTEADSDEDEDCDLDGGSEFVFHPVDTDDEDENVVDALQQDLETSVLPTLRDDEHEEVSTRPIDWQPFFSVGGGRR